MERKKFFARRPMSSARPETFAITVEGYDTSSNNRLQHKVLGTRLDNGEQVAVTLRDVEYKQAGRFKRSEITDFAAPRKDRQHPGTTAGGTLLIQEALSQVDGTHGARWIQSLSHTPGEAEVFLACVHVTPVRRAAQSSEFPEGRPYSLMTVLHDGNFNHLSEDMANAINYTPPFKVESVAELSEAATDLLRDGLGVGVRVSNPDGFDAMYVPGKHSDLPEDRVAAFLKDVEPIAAGIDDGSVVCEVIPYGNVWAGPATVDMMQTNKPMMSRVEQFQHEVAGAQGGRSYGVSVYRPAIVAARLTKPDAEGKRSMFFSHVEPLWTRQPVHGLVGALCYAITDELAPEPPMLNAPANQAIAGNQPSSNPDPAHDDEGAGSFSAEDPGLRDLDLISAAASGGQPEEANADIGEDIPVAQDHPAQQERSAPRSRYAGRARA